jgi:transposase-like protein
MHKKPNSESSGTLLKRIGRAFAFYRSNHKSGRVRYPSHLKEMATSAVSDTCRAAQVARSAGISEQALSYWLKLATERPRELIVEDGPQPAPTPEPANNIRTARLHFRSGAVMEVPVSMLSTDLIAALNSAVAP